MLMGAPMGPVFRQLLPRRATPTQPEALSRGNRVDASRGGADVADAQREVRLLNEVAPGERADPVPGVLRRGVAHFAVCGRVGADDDRSGDGRLQLGCICSTARPAASGPRRGPATTAARFGCAATIMRRQVRISSRSAHKIETHYLVGSPAARC